ncbi:2'-deoxynucleoside 5'-phosphate N-hydrolase 1 isoform X1 [Conger conger]|uniref:2'-deoxynucleoside 5'-phosphate N-hydrolase 1 isoform X1 n=1 Tax=Conger conger TaxID=82655 RepID=UPI002A5AF459|nr:2'-deoxynucleoside 5'-phosphate N-hydrolase 1 isoform X1 [Conger conger]
MRIYFCGSIRGGRQDLLLYQRIVEKLQTYGKVLTEHVSHGDISEKDEGAELKDDRAIHDRDMDWLVTADVIVAEVTQPSLGVGYELGRAVAMHKKIFCLFRPSSGRVLSAMIRGADSGCQSSVFQVRDYSEADVETVLQEYFSSLKPNADAH